MTGRILIVDAVPTNRIVMRVKLASAFYEVVQAASGDAALRKLRAAPHDMVILSDNLPDMSAPKACAALRRMPQSKRLPVIAILADENAKTRRDCLLAGADDVATRPIDDLILLARIRSLLRARDTEAELDLRDETGRALGMREDHQPYDTPAQICITSADPTADLTGLALALGQAMRGQVSIQNPDLLMRHRAKTPDVIIIVENDDTTCEGLSLLPQLRTHADTRNASVVYLSKDFKAGSVVPALDMGACDVAPTNGDIQELALRIQRQVSRKQMADRLRASMRDGARAAMTDPLTGLYNRRYAIPHLERLVARATQTGRGCAVLMADVDHFKPINDSHGHAAGDRVLVELATRLRASLSPGDTLSRIGGEEFLITMPDTNAELAMQTAEWLRALVADNPFDLGKGQSHGVTLSFGVALLTGATSADRLLERADTALYAAKEKGRNAVVLADAVTRFRPAPKTGFAPLPMPYKTVQPRLGHHKG